MADDQSGDSLNTVLNEELIQSELDILDDQWMLMTVVVQRERELVTDGRYNCVLFQTNCKVDEVDRPGTKHC